MSRILGMIAFFAALFTKLVCGETLSDGLRASYAGRYAGPAGIWGHLAKDVGIDAQTTLGNLCVSAPPGVSYGPKQAEYLYLLVARRGNSVAQMNLGDFYAQGVGVERELGRAAFLLGLASDVGFDWAAQRLQKIKPQMSANERARFWRLQAEWSDQQRK